MEEEKFMTKLKIKKDKKEIGVFFFFFLEKKGKEIFRKSQNSWSQKLLCRQRTHYEI